MAENADQSVGLGPSPGQWLGKPQEPSLGFADFPLSMRLVQYLFWPAYFFMMFQVSTSHSQTGVWIVMGVLCLQAITLVAWLISRWRRWQASSRDRVLLEDIFGDQYLVEVVVSVEGEKGVADRGAIWFADGLMGFNGRAFAFALAACDLSQPAWEDEKRIDGRPYPRRSLVLNGAPKPSYIFIIPLNGHEWYWDSLKRFLTAHESTKGERSWPPLEPYRPVDKELEIARRI